MKKCKLSNKILEGTLHIMNDNTKTIVIAMNEGEAWDHETMDEDAQHAKILELGHRWIISPEKNKSWLHEELKSFSDGLRHLFFNFKTQYRFLF